jgi:hypothetical protein
MTTSDAIALCNALATALTPLAVVGVGYYLDRRVKRVEQSIEAEHRLSGTRFELYRDIGFQLNDIYAYFNYVGSWKSLTPAHILDCKRKLDRHVYTFKPLFSCKFFEHYIAFVDSTFRTNTGWRQDAKLRTWSVHRAEDGDPDMMQCFTQEDNLAEIKASYGRLLACLAENLGVGQEER